MAMNNYGGTKAAVTENFNNRIEGLKIEAESGLAWWQKMTVAIVITVVSIGIDFITFFSLFDKCFTQSALMVVVMSLGVAMVIDTLPLVIAKFVHYALYKTKRHAAAMLAIMLTGFFIIFGATLFLRFSYRDMYGQEQQSFQLENTVSNKELELDTAPKSNVKGTAVVLLLGLSPLVTSIVTFGIAYASDDEIERKYHYHKKRDYELDEAISDLEAAIETLNIDVARDLKLDEEAMESAIEKIISSCDTMKSLARTYLEKYLADPSATSKISKEMIMEYGLRQDIAAQERNHDDTAHEERGVIIDLNMASGE